MKFIGHIQILIIFLCLSACQVKEKDASTGLISGHVPTTNSFTVTTPTAGQYITGSVLSVVVTFPFNVVVTGTPRLTLTIGVTTRYANYASGTGTKNLTFNYTIIAADNDSDGVALVNLGLNGGTLQFSSGATMIDCDVTTVGAKTWSSVIVDNTAATITGFNITTLPGYYHLGQNLNFTFTFSEAVYVTGSPRFSLDFTTGGPVFATYAGGSGTTTLSFSFTIDNTVGDANAYDTITSPISLNSGTIKDAAANDATLTFPGLIAAVLAVSSTVNFDGTLPYVSSVTTPGYATYGAANNLDFSVVFDRAVTVTGSPYIAVTIGSTVRQAVYQSGSATNTLLFRYVTVPGDVDADGIAVASTITQNSGTIVGTAAPANSFFAVAANNAFTVPPTTGVLVTAVQPQATSVSRNVDNTTATWGTALDNVWMTGQDLVITVGFNTPMYVDQTGGIPRIPITIGVTTQYASYLSGGNGQTSLVFHYVIQNGDLDTDTNIALGNIDLNGGSITDVTNTNTLLTLPSAALATTQIDGVKPTISSVAKPANGTYSTVTGNNHTNMAFTINWSEAVDYANTALVGIPLVIGATPISADYSSGNQTAAIIHRVASLAGLTDANGIASSSPITNTTTIKDQAGNIATVFTFTPPVTTSVLVDTTLPTVSSTTSPTAGTYNAGNNLNFSVVFSEVVNVLSSGGYPRIALAFDSGTKYATYLSGSGTNTINFRYTVVSGDSDLTGVTNPATVSIANAPTAYIRDLGWNNNTATSYPITSNLAGVLVDAIAPSITGRTYPGNGTYESGDVLQFTVTYDEAVIVTGTPSIQVAAQTGTLDFSYLSGSGTTTLTFQYTVNSNDFDFDGLSNSVTTIGLNGGTIADAQSNAAALVFASVNLSGLYVAYPNTVIWSTSAFTNLAASGGITVSSSGAVSTQACGTGTCRTFNGDDSFDISGAISGVENVFIVFKTDSSLANYDIFGTDVSLVDDGSAFDLTTANANINLDGVTTSGTSHDTNMTISSTHILQVAFTGTPGYGAGSLITSSFLGAIGEVIVVNGALTNAQKTQIRTYLNAKY